MADETTPDETGREEPAAPEGGDAPPVEDSPATDAAASSAVPALEDVAAQLRAVRSAVGGLEDFVDWAVPILEAAERQAQEGDGKGDGKGGKEKEEPKPKPVFPHAAAWVEGWFIPTFQRKVGPGSLRWCRLWWAHPEAMVRFEALWRSWEVLRLDVGTGLGVWFRDHFDSQLPLLLGPDGPYAQCTTDKHEPVPDLPAEPVPAAVIEALTAAAEEPPG
ncbi:DUF4913 domain-containing protein [Streptomyces sp. NPDC001492]